MFLATYPCWLLLADDSCQVQPSTLEKPQPFIKKKSGQLKLLIHPYFTPFDACLSSNNQPSRVEMWILRNQLTAVKMVDNILWIEAVDRVVVLCIPRFWSQLGVGVIGVGVGVVGVVVGIIRG